MVTKLSLLFGAFMPKTRKRKKIWLKKKEKLSLYPLEKLGNWNTR